MIRRMLGDDPLLLSVADEYFTGNPYGAVEKAEKIFLERQDRYSLMLLKMAKPFNSSRPLKMPLDWLKFQ